MAQTTIEPGGALVIEGDIKEATDDGGTGPQSAEEELLLRSVTRIRQGCPKAAMSCIVEAANLLAKKYGLSGGAWE